MTLSAPQPEHWTSRLIKGVARLLLVVAVVLAVLVILFFIVYGSSTLRHRSHTNHGAMVVLNRLR
jgi:Na+-transporting methylmalonyl-CoA/oxaloacetate decarboxylase gamma subunit